MALDNACQPRRRLLLAPLLAAALTSGASAAEHRDPTSGCVVQAPRYLASNDFIFSYEGACRNGVAEGQGKAIWTLRHAPQKRHEWAGRFSSGIFLPEPSQGLTASVLKGENLLFDLGPLPKLKGLSPRLVVQASGDMTQAADPCKPDTLWVLQAGGGSLESDDVAKPLLQSAVDKLKQRCGVDRLQALSTTTTRTHLRVRGVPQAALELDGYGNPQGIVVEASVPLQPQQELQQYINQAASKRRQEQARAERQQAQQANAERLQAFARSAGAQLWAGMPALAQNPFRFQDQVVLTAVHLDEVQSPSRARVAGLGRSGAYQFATLEGEGLGRWAPGARVLAVRVLGRLPATDELHPSGVRLQLVSELRCEERDCSDRLFLPRPLEDGAAP
jgi:sRNA-binding protein